MFHSGPLRCSEKKSVSDITGSKLLVQKIAQQYIPLFLNAFHLHMPLIAFCFLYLEWCCFCFCRECFFKDLLSPHLKWLILYKWIKRRSGHSFKMEAGKIDICSLWFSYKKRKTICILLMVPLSHILSPPVFFILVRKTFHHLTLSIPLANKCYQINTKKSATVTEGTFKHLTLLIWYSSCWAKHFCMHAGRKKRLIWLFSVIGIKFNLALSLICPQCWCQHISWVRPLQWPGLMSEIVKNGWPSDSAFHTKQRWILESADFYCH